LAVILEGNELNLQRASHLRWSYKPEIVKSSYILRIWTFLTLSVGKPTSGGWKPKKHL